MTLSFAWLIIAIVGAAMSQVLSPSLSIVEHSALVSLYDEIGSAPIPIELESEFQSIVPQPGCSESTCPRFSNRGPCVGEHIVCNNAHVEQLSENVLLFFFFALPRLNKQT